MHLEYAIVLSIRYPCGVLKEKEAYTMIKRNELKPSEKPAFRYGGDDSKILSIGVIQQLLRQKNEEAYGLPINISTEQVKSGGLFNSTVEDCVIITNKEHPSDYFTYCLMLQKQGKMAYLSSWYYGSSTLTGKAHQAEARKGSLGGMLLNAVAGVNQSAYDAEYQYYDMLDSLISEAFS